MMLLTLAEGVLPFSISQNGGLNKKKYKDSELFQLYRVATHGTPDFVLVLFYFLKVYRQYLVIFELETLE